MIVGTNDTYKETKTSLERIQSFDVSSLPREKELGSTLSFGEAIEPAKNLVSLFQRLSVTALQDFPDPNLNIIKSQANNIFNLFKQALDFDAAQQDPSTQRNSIISNIRNSYQSVFQDIHPFISYSLHRSADFQRLDSDARSVLQAIQDSSSKLSLKLKESEDEAQRILGEIRKVAAEEGVSQQAKYFNDEFKSHEEEAEKWKKLANKLAIGLGIFAVISLFIHKIPFLKPENLYDSIQLSISKFLIFSVIAYMLFLATKNFLNHKHNAIVNKHRQNALTTHRALVEASGENSVRDAVLIQAASCIFSPQSTGYINSASNNEITSPKSVIEILTKPISKQLGDIDN